MPPEMRLSRTAASVAGRCGYQEVRSTASDVVAFGSRLLQPIARSDCPQSGSHSSPCLPWPLPLVHTLPSHRIGQVCSTEWAGRRMDCPLLDGNVR